MSKTVSPKMPFSKTNAWDCRTDRVHFSTRAIYVKRKKRRCLTRCCSLRNQQVQEVNQKQIRRDARQEADMTRSEAHRKQANTKKPYFP